MSAGGSATDGGEGFYSLASFSTVKSGADLGIFVKKTGDVHAVFFFDTAGAPVGLAAMRRVADALHREMETEFPAEKAGEDDYYGEYIHFLVDNAGPITEKLAVPEGAAGEAIYAAASLLGGFCEIGTGSMAAQGYIFVNAEKESALEVSYRTADGSFAMIDRWHATAALLCEALKKGKKEVLLPASSPHALRDMVTGMGGTVRLYGSADTEALTREEALSALWQNDMLLLSLLFISSLGASREMPERASSFATAEKTLSVPDAAEVLSVLYDHGAGTEDGVLCLRFGSFLVRVTAKDSKTISLFAEGGTPHEAEDALRYAEKGILESVPSLQ